MSDMLNSIGIKSMGEGTVNTEPKKDRLDQTDFLKLLITQIQAQNPLDPAEGADFIAQMAQFGTSEGIAELNQSMGTMTDYIKSSKALDAAKLLGREVQTQTELGTLTDNNVISGSVEIPDGATNVKLSVQRLNGEVVDEVALGNHLEGGMTAFAWDGSDGEQSRFPGGRYKFLVSADIDGTNTALNTYIGNIVGSVNLNANSETSVNVDNVGEVKLTDILAIK